MLTVSNAWDTIRKLENNRNHHWVRHTKSKDSPPFAAAKWSDINIYRDLYLAFSRLYYAHSVHSNNIILFYFIYIYSDEVAQVSFYYPRPPHRMLDLISPLTNLKELFDFAWMLWAKVRFPWGKSGKFIDFLGLKKTHITSYENLKITSLYGGRLYTAGAVFD